MPPAAATRGASPDLDSVWRNIYRAVDQHGQVIDVLLCLNKPIEADHGQLKHRLRPMRGLQTDRPRFYPGGTPSEISS